MAKAKAILTEAHRQLLVKVLESCAHTREFLKSCKECTLDVDEEIRVNEEQCRTATAMLERFFPNRP